MDMTIKSAKTGETFHFSSMQNLGGKVFMKAEKTQGCNSIVTINHFVSIEEVTPATFKTVCKKMYEAAQQA